ncbi:hypothetical protein [Paenibacillus eucommiae]|uniref:WGR domain-containing protein n=1 Tax=Paenibacillus eucommiae TaxID=1355755 RepID=A0ABS4J3J7_9BACL|nr:hypothetical protein [Paenibacillus eucommiae]MBP1994415.1 hypothetical protein [Paenibacillus eucommiae]
MIKLYKKEKGKEQDQRTILYFEAWLEPDNRRAVIHSGVSGRNGKTEYAEWDGQMEEVELLETLLKKARAGGYVEIPAEHHDTVIVQYKIKGKGSKADLVKRQRVERMLDQVLGWKGLGHVDGGDIGNKTMNIFCIVVDGALAAATVKNALKTYREDVNHAVIAIGRTNESPVIFHPKDYKEPFSF